MRNMRLVVVTWLEFGASNFSIYRMYLIFLTGTELGRGRGVLGRPGSRESMFDTTHRYCFHSVDIFVLDINFFGLNIEPNQCCFLFFFRDLVSNEFAPRNGIAAGMDLDRQVSISTLHNL